MKRLQLLWKRGFCAHFSTALLWLRADVCNTLCKSWRELKVSWTMTRAVLPFVGATQGVLVTTGKQVSVSLVTLGQTRQSYIVSLLQLNNSAAVIQKNYSTIKPASRAWMLSRTGYNQNTRWRPTHSCTCSLSDSKIIHASCFWIVLHTSMFGGPLSTFMLI